MDATLLEPCIPCIKEILNGRALNAWKESHAAAQKIEALVAAGRLDKAAAVEILRQLKDHDERYEADVRSTVMQMAEATRPPEWLVGV